MSKFMETVRKLFSRIKNGNEDSGDSTREPNSCQTVVKAPRNYDEIVMDEDGPNVEDTGENVQSAPPRAPRSYEEVEIPAPNSGDGIAIIENNR